MSKNELKVIDDIHSQIYTIRGVQVMLDMDLAILYHVGTRVLNQAVKRNLDRFPEQFCFQLTDGEFEILKSQIVMSSWGGRRTNPYAFTEQGVAMLSAVLRRCRRGGQHPDNQRLCSYAPVYCLERPDIPKAGYARIEAIED